MRRQFLSLEKKISKSGILTGKNLKIRDIFTDFLKQCLTINTQKRPSATELLHHPFIMLSDQELPAEPKKSGLKIEPKEKPNFKKQVIGASLISTKYVKLTFLALGLFIFWRGMETLKQNNQIDL